MLKLTVLLSREMKREGKRGCAQEGNLTQQRVTQTQKATTRRGVSSCLALLVSNIVVLVHSTVCCIEVVRVRR